MNRLKLYLVFLVVSVNAVKAQNENKKIMGRWVSEQDRKYEVVFNKSQKLDYYEKELTSTFNYQIKRDSLIAKDVSDNVIYYYLIDGVTDSYLSLTFLPRGNLLLFRKVKHTEKLFKRIHK